MPKTAYEQTSGSESHAPPLPRHIDTERPSTDQYGMKEIPVNSPSPYPVYSNSSVPSQYNNNNNNDLGRNSMSDMKFMDHYDSDDDLERIIPKEKKRRSCLDKTCCGCCTCCPKWMRWCSCIFLIIILIIVIIIGALAATFKVPTIDVSDLNGAPVTTMDSGALNINFSVNITVDNPNILGLTFETIKVEAYYPAPYNVYIGGGNVTDTVIAKKAISTFEFPFTVRVDGNDPAQRGVILDLMTHCGLDGSPVDNIDFDYYVHPTVRIAGIPITPQIKQSMSLPCPIQSGDLSSIVGNFLK